MDSAIRGTVRSAGTLHAPVPVCAHDAVMQAATIRNSSQSQEEGLAIDLVHRITT